MKTGRSLTELAQEIERQQAAKKDFLAATDKTSVIVQANNAASIQIGEDENLNFPINEIAHRQIRDHVGIPAIYYDRMRKEAPDLYAQNVNHWLVTNAQKRMYRTLDGNLRAFLSDRFRPLENIDLAEAALPAIMGLGVNILSCEITDAHLYIKAVDKRIEMDIPYGHKMGDGSHKFFDTVSPAIIISNSEVGMGRLQVETAVWTHLCTNMAISKQRSLAKHHVGAKHEIMGDGLYELLSDETRRKTDEATWAQVGDVIKGAFEKARFESLVKSVTDMAEQKIEGDVVKVVELASKRFTLAEGERSSVLKHLIQGGDLSRYGLFNALTRTAEDCENYERATDLERLGGEIIELPTSEWREIAEAA